MAGPKLGSVVCRGKRYIGLVGCFMPSRAELRLLPNVLSFSRLLLAAGFVGADTGMRVGLVGAAAATDFLDGWLARRVNAASRWGAIIDPIADRVFSLVAIVTFYATGALSLVGLFVMLSRDIMTCIGFIVARTVSWLRPVELKARFPGKLCTTLQLLTFVALLLVPRYVTPLVVLVGIASAWAIVDYTLMLWNQRAR